LAIDTEDKRRSVAGIPMVPDGTIASPDFQHIAGFYRGITIDPPVETEGGGTFMLLGVE